MQAKPCPFCGERERFMFECCGRVAQILCMACGARGPEVDRFAPAMVATDAWDRRVTPGVPGTSGGGNA